MKAEHEHPPGKTWLDRPPLRGEVRFENVSFAYPGQSGHALEGVSFAIQPGERVAVLGGIGSGKTTLMRLLLGLYQPDEGVVMIDGIDIRQMDPLDLRRNIGAALQDPWLVSGTLRENIGLGAARPTDREILRAAQLSGVETFAARHPDGYDMVLGERGAGLSGGERQAVALARALIGNPPVLIMDEPTSAMDLQAEAELVARLDKVMQGRTVIVMTHRRSLLKLVNRVIVLDRGRIVADGVKDSPGTVKEATA